MKTTRKLLALLLVLCLSLSLFVLPAAAEDYEYSVSDTAMSIGTNTVTADSSVVTIFEFVAGTAGNYTVTTSTAGAKLYAASGTAFFVFGITPAENNTLVLEITEASANSPKLIGVTGSGNVSVKIEKTSENTTVDPGTLPYTKYEAKATVTPFTMNADDAAKLEYVNLQEAHTAVLGSDGYYHLDKATGPILYMNIGGSAPYVSLYGAQGYGQNRCYVYENGELKAKLDFYDCLETYFANMDKSGLYPVTEDLIYIMQTMGKAKGWYDADVMGNYLFSGETVNEDTAWMCTIAYVPDPVIVAPTDGTGDYNNDGLVTNEDVVYLLWHTLYSDDYPVATDADFNDDGDVTNEDVVYLLWHTLYPNDYPLVKA